MPSLILFNKPYGVLCQFTGEVDDSTLSDFIPIKSVYPAGRLDKDSEGLLLLTDDGKLQHQITHPTQKMMKRYWVQVDNSPDEEALSVLRKGCPLKDHHCLPADVKRIQAPAIWERIPPIRERKHIPTTWLQINIKEGKNRQIRRMTAHIGYPTLRLIRFQIGAWQLGELQPGEYRKLTL